MYFMRRIHSYHQLGDGSDVDKLTPVQECKTYAGTCTEYLTGIDQIESGFYTSMAIDNSGTLWGWGYNTNHRN